MSSPTTTELAEEARRVIAEIDDRGAWAEPGWVRDPMGMKVEPSDGIIRSQTFIENVAALSQFILKTQ
jgi:hypothetical protein